MNPLRFAIGGALAWSMGAMGAVTSFPLGTVYDGSVATGSGGLAVAGSYFTVTFEDGADASVAGAVDVKLKATGLSVGQGEHATQWWLNFDGGAGASARDLLVSYRTAGDFALSAYRFERDAVGGAGGNYGNFDIGVRFDLTPDRQFDQGSELTMTFRLDGRALTTSSFLSYTTSLDGSKPAVVTAVRFADALEASAAYATHAGTFLAPTPVAITPDAGVVIVEPNALLPEASTWFAGAGVMGLGGLGWWRARRRSTA